MLHQVIETLSSRVALRPRYENFIGGEWVEPVDGRYFDNISPLTGKPVCQIARSQSADIELALDAAHKAREAWGQAEAAKIIARREYEASDECKLARAKEEAASLQVAVDAKQIEVAALEAKVK